MQTVRARDLAEALALMGGFEAGGPFARFFGACGVVEVRARAGFLGGVLTWGAMMLA